MRVFRLEFISNPRLLAFLGLLVFATVTVTLNLPSQISIGEKGQAATRMLDTIRHPFVEIKKAETILIGTDDRKSALNDFNKAVETENTLLTSYRQLAAYNPELSRRVAKLSEAYEDWMTVEREVFDRFQEDSIIVDEYNQVVKAQILQDLNMSSALFLYTMKQLGEVELITHEDISRGRSATHIFITSLGMLFSYLIGLIYLQQRAKTRELEIKVEMRTADLKEANKSLAQEITDRRVAQEEVERSLSLLQATLESTADGILVLNSEGKIISNNKRFLEMWHIPESVVSPQDANKALTYVLDQLKDSKGFLARMRELYSQPDAKSYDVLEFRDGRVFERYSRPQYIAGKSIGRVWSFRDITERKQAEKEIYQLAYYDLLTGLPNRLMLRDDIDRAISASRSKMQSFALFMINLDRFHEINNTLGHQNGDIILQQIGNRLIAILDEEDKVYHTGGDGFGILLANSDADGADKTARKIVKGLEEPYTVEGISLDISSSIGISIFPGHGEDADILTRRANIAMHIAKKTEIGYSVYSPKNDQFIPERLELMGELRHSIEEGHLFLQYQPKIDLKIGMTTGVEALVRWQHPKLGVIPPDKFISLAEHTGMITQLTLWVLKEALRQSRSWNEMGIEVSIAVNLSNRNLQSPQILDQIKGQLSAWGVRPGLIRFEITESVIMADPVHTMEVIKELTAMGIRFSVDDFGTGYSSLSYLQRLPVDEIKIDRSFVIDIPQDESSMKIVRSIIELGHSLGLKVVAEGVETREALDKLIELGCDQAQGYFISKPFSQEEFMIWLNKQENKHFKASKEICMFPLM